MFSRASVNKSRFECKNKRYLLLHCEHYGAWYAQTVCVSFILEARGGAFMQKVQKGLIEVQ